MIKTAEIGGKLEQAMVTDAQSLAVKLNTVAGLMREYRALLSSKQEAADMTALVAESAREGKFMEQALRSCGAFLKELGLPPGRLFSASPIVTPKQLEELGATVLDFDTLVHKPLNEISDRTGHFQRLTRLTENVRLFFERLGDSAVSAQAAGCYEELRDRSSAYPEYEAGKPIPLQMKFSFVFGALSRTV